MAAPQSAASQIAPGLGSGVKTSSRVVSPWDDRARASGGPWPNSPVVRPLVARPSCSRSSRKSATACARQSSAASSASRSSECHSNSHFSSRSTSITSSRAPASLESPNPDAERVAARRPHDSIEHVRTLAVAGVILCFSAIVVLSLVEPWNVRRSWAPRWPDLPRSIPAPSYTTLWDVTAVAFGAVEGGRRRRNRA